MSSPSASRRGRTGRVLVRRDQVVRVELAGSLRTEHVSTKELPQKGEIAVTQPTQMDPMGPLKAMLMPLCRVRIDIVPLVKMKLRGLLILSFGLIFRIEKC